MSDRSSMEMRQLRYFVQIVESGSFAQAARQLYVAQPALSQQIAKLESHVGKRLLNRSAKGATPTGNGQALYHHAKFLLRQLDQALFIARQQAEPVSGRVSLGLPPAMLCVLGPPLLRHLREIYPRIQLNIVEGLTGNLGRMACDGQLDLAVLFSQSAASDLAVEPLLDEELFLTLPINSKLVAARRRQLSMADVTRLPLILPSDTHGLRHYINREFEKYELFVEPIIEVDALHLLMACVYDGMGVTIQPMSSTFALRGLEHQWRRLRLAETRMLRRNYLYSRPPETLSACAAIVHAEIKRVIRKLGDSGTWKEMVPY
jgi:LysR family tcuABC transcriptional regulator